ncbi:MAG: peptidoglycan DD-metalloendopeptidase family protein [Rhodospirillales bacterium]|nr:peptidoglycan DD-metalloendopeptidase family protein [Rhodospirillales bacterium]
MSKFIIFINAVARYVPLRHRYLLTRNNRLRLRFVVLPLIAGLSFGLAAMVGFSKDSGAVRMPVPMERSMAQALQPAVYRPSFSVLDGQSQEQAALPEAEVVLAAVSAPMPQPKEEHLKIGKGDTLTAVLEKAGISASDAYRVVKAMEDDYDPRHIRPGQVLAVRYDPSEDGDDYSFAAMRMDIDPLKTLVLSRQGDGFVSDIEEKETVRRTYARDAEIEVSLFGSAAKAGVPNGVIAEAIRIFSWDVDFQRDIRQGDKLEVLYEQIETEDGELIKSGDVLYARLNVNGRDIPVYRYEDKNGDVDYYTAEGRSIRKALMKTPIDGARVSSGFGLRKHPVLGYSKMHKGLDFAAPTGTPIYAAGDGTVEKAGRWSSFGNYIRIRHNSSLKTAYAHLNRIERGVTPGSRVKQGQVIGYVGTTGRSTGPHLHYEVMVNGAQVNPQSHKSPQGKSLTGEQLNAFKVKVGALDKQYASLLTDGDDRKTAMNLNQ